MVLRGTCVEVHETNGYIYHVHGAGSWFGELGQFLPAVRKGRRTSGICAEEVIDTLEIMPQTLE